MNPNQRKIVYAVLVALNGAAMALSQSGALAGVAAQGLQLATLVLAMFMKEVQSA